MTPEKFVPAQGTGGGPRRDGCRAEVPAKAAAVGAPPPEGDATPPPGARALTLRPDPAGVGSVSVTVPNAPALVGLSIHAQALLLQWPAAAHLTNVTADRIVR